MRRYAVIEKPVGETPLQALQAYQRSDAELARVPLTYAGRLDPMASGKLLVLIGDECKKRDQYDGLDKEYVFEVLLGFKTDTGDVLGLPEASKAVGVKDREVNDVAQSLVGPLRLAYPAYSSKTVAGKPLFQYALEGTLSTIEIPTVDVHVYALQYVDRLALPRSGLVERILAKIDQLTAGNDSGLRGADFRKDEISKGWWRLESRERSTCSVLRFKVIVSSGTYIRSLAPLIAARLGTDGLAYSIHRTKIGRYMSLTKHFGFWTRAY